MKNFETEYKLDANTPGAFMRARRFLQTLNLNAKPQLLQIKDTYLDHANRDLAAQKIALRVRNTDGKWETTFKTRTQIKQGKAVRQEETLPLPRVTNLKQALQFLEQKKQWKQLNVRALQVQFAIANKRTVYGFNYDGEKLEMALDDVTLRVCGRQLKMKEIEIELKGKNVSALDRFVQQFVRATKLKRMQISKVKTAEKLLAMWKK
ncbi:MAG: CYTH domain-containing protein [Elusimicrobiaceae bacterium]|nr:CYTH domain-containing protein [Elusimicrobiaceae bacterium]